MDAAREGSLPRVRGISSGDRGRGVSRLGMRQFNGGWQDLGKGAAKMWSSEGKG